jgi:hypothetical protein
MDIEILYEYDSLWNASLKATLYFFYNMKSPSNFLESIMQVGSSVEIGHMLDFI